MGPSILFDKSAIQSLGGKSLSEVSRYFYTVVPPLLLMETLADLSLKPDDLPLPGAKRKVAEIAPPLLFPKNSDASHASKNPMRMNEANPVFVNNGPAPLDSIIGGDRRTRRRKASSATRLGMLRRSASPKEIIQGQSLAGQVRRGREPMGPAIPECSCAIAGLVATMF